MGQFKGPNVECQLQEPNALLFEFLSLQICFKMRPAPSKNVPAVIQIKSYCERQGNERSTVTTHYAAITNLVYTVVNALLYEIVMKAFQKYTFKNMYSNVHFQWVFF